MPDAETLLRQLLADHFFVTGSGSLSWNYVEGVDLREVGEAALEKALIPYLKPEDAAEVAEAHKALEAGATPAP